jgi:hypothetical protein
MKRFLILLALVAGCGASDQTGSNGTETSGGGAPAQGPPASAAPATAVIAADLTGLYEGGPAAQPNQLCIVDKAGGAAQFGVVIWGSSMHSCSGAGEAVRDGNRLTLKMAGDETCTLDATIDGLKVTLPSEVGPGCAYYCGARAGFANAELVRKGATVEDALKARDLVGEPLCSR